MLLVFVIFQLSWSAMVGAVAPMALWESGQWWPYSGAFGAHRLMRLAVVGATGMGLCVREDDPPAVIQAVSCLLCCGGLVVVVNVAVNVRHHLYNLHVHNDSPWLLPWAGSYRWWTLGVTDFGELLTGLDTCYHFNNVWALHQS